MASEPWQRLHADHCGPFLMDYYALVVVNALSKLPEVLMTKCATLKALRKAFSREGVPAPVVNDNGRHFSAKSVTDWLRQIGSRHVFTEPRHPQSNGLAENFVKTFKSAILAMNRATLDDQEQKVDNFLLHYRNEVHCSTRKAPAV